MGAFLLFAFLVSSLLVVFPVYGHDALSLQDIEAAVERVLQRRDIKRRNFGLCEHLTAGLIEERVTCLEEKKRTQRCLDGTAASDLVLVFNRPECAHFSQVHARCWSRWLASSDPWDNHLFDACMNDPMGWIITPKK